MSKVNLLVGAVIATNLANELCWDLEVRKFIGCQVVGSLLAVEYSHLGHVDLAHFDGVMSVVYKHL